MATPRQIARKVDRMLNAGQKARMGQLAGIERLIVLKLLTEIGKEVETGDDGRVRSRKGYASLSRLVDRVFAIAEERELGKLGSAMIGDIKGVFKHNADYFGAMAITTKKEFKAIRSAVDARMRQRLGIDSEDGIKRKGYLDQLFTTGAARDEVKKLIAKQVAAGVPMRKLEKALRLKVQGTKQVAGVMERHLGGFVLDTYNVADAVSNKEFARRLDLKYFIYSGGLIETSRPFCIKRNNKVFTTEEAERDWPKDSTLPRTKAEKDAGGEPADYNPLEDCGRWNCRHRIMYIDEQAAFVLRPELKSKR